MVAIARRTGDSTRDLAARHNRDDSQTHSRGLMPALEGEVEEDLGKVFGEELPSGLVAAAS